MSIVDGHMALMNEFWLAMFISFCLGLLLSPTLMPKINYITYGLINMFFYTSVICVFYVTLSYIKYYDLY